MNTLFYPWHLPLYTCLTTAFLQGRGHHALLFKTEIGLGTEQLILHFAHWLFCLNKQNEQSCSACKGCLLWQSQNHPDFHLIEPLENRDIGVDQIRELTTKLQQFSQQGGNSVVYIKGVHRLTEAAANALLKTLEEPRDNVYFLLEAPIQTPMLATIQSRCQTWLVNAPSFLQASDWLQNEFPALSQEEISTVLRLNYTRPLHSKIFLENDRLSVRKQFLQTFWRFFKTRDVWLLLSSFDKEKEEVLQQLEWLDSFFADSLKAKLNIASGWLNPDLYNGIELFSQALTPQQLLKGHQIIFQTQQALLSVNAVNIELMLANCLTQLVCEVFVMT